MILETIRDVIRRLFHVNMNRIVVAAIALSIAGFAYAWLELVEVSLIPLGAVFGSLFVGGRYAIDRWGFGKIDTIAILRDHPREYFGVLREYGLLWVGGFVLAAILLGSHGVAG
jgi:hypothetical protein